MARPLTWIYAVLLLISVNLSSQGKNVFVYHEACLNSTLSFMKTFYLFILITTYTGYVNIYELLLSDLSKNIYILSIA